VDVDTRLVHIVIGEAANAHDVTQASALLLGEEIIAFGDAGYQGVEERPEATYVNWQIAMRPGNRRTLDNHSQLGTLLDKAEQHKANVHVKVEQPFKVLKCEFGFTKVRDKVLAKNTAQLITLVA
jgi:IS5 family transposase